MTDLSTCLNKKSKNLKRRDKFCFLNVFRGANFDRGRFSNNTTRQIRVFAVNTSNSASYIIRLNSVTFESERFLIHAF